MDLPSLSTQHSRSSQNWAYWGLCGMDASALVQGLVYPYWSVITS